MISDTAIARLQRALRDSLEEADGDVGDILERRDEVLARYQPMFSPEGIRELTAEDFHSFLLFRNNRHWKHIHRQSGLITSDMDRLREALLLLTDESRSISERLKVLRPKDGDPMIKGLARSVITPILLVSNPKKYGVLNQIAESGMKAIDVWPDLERGTDFADKYVAVNGVLTELTQRLEIDFWQLDALWWRIDSDADPDEDDEEELPALLEEYGEERFGLERHLHDFLRDNWDRTELGREWELLEEDGELVGYEYMTHEVGKIDLLARHRQEPRWLVVELKRGRTSDRTVGQALRYRGWVQRRLAEPGETVEAIVISHRADPKLMYAVDSVPGVEAKTYSVRFELREPDAPWGDQDHE